jgi:hypothetical protein
LRRVGAIFKATKRADAEQGELAQVEMFGIKSCHWTLFFVKSSSVFDHWYDC